MTDGEAEIDMTSLDPRRYGPWITTEYACRKNEEAYDHVFILHHPDEERPAARPLRTAPCYDRMAARGAQFGQVAGWERPTYFAEPGFDDHAARSFRRGGWWARAEAEAQAIRDRVGLIDVTPFAKHEVSGKGAAAFLEWYATNALPKVGRVSLTYTLSPVGTVASEYTVARLAEDRFYLVSAGAWHAYDHDLLMRAIEDARGEFGDIRLSEVTSQMGVFAVTGPGAREVLRGLVADADPQGALSNRRFPWLSVRDLELGMVPVRAMRVSYTGSLGWELHHPMEMQNHLFDRLMAAGEPHGLRLCGSRAMNWLRQEKSYRAWGAELGRDATPLEAGLDRFVDCTRPFRGKAAMRETGIRSRCVTLLIDGPDDADPWGREALYDGDGGARVGRLTSGGWSVSLGRQIGMGYVTPDRARPGTRLRVKMLDRLWDAEVVEDTPWDPGNAALRADG